MPDFSFTQAPLFSPTRCAACSTHKCDEGFVDLICSTATAGFAASGGPAPARDDEPTYGRLYLCARCVWTAARLVGCLDPQEAGLLRGAVVEATWRSEELSGALAEAEASKVVSLPDLSAWMDRQRAENQSLTGEFVTAVEQSLTLDAPRYCSATKKNGEPCKGIPPAGETVCVAHAQTPAVA